MVEDIQTYRAGTRLHNEENVDLYSSTSKINLNDTMDDNFREQVTISEFTLKAWDFYLYIIGMMVRIQTIVLGYILFGVETDRTCVVVYESNTPLPLTMLPANLDALPGGFANMSRVF